MSFIKIDKSKNIIAGRDVYSDGDMVMGNKKVENITPQESNKQTEKGILSLLKKGWKLIVGISVILGIIVSIFVITEYITNKQPIKTLTVDSLAVVDTPEDTPKNVILPTIKYDDKIIKDVQKKQEKSGKKKETPQILSEKICEIGEAYGKIDSTWAWKNAKEDAERKLFQHPKLKKYDVSDMVYEIDSNQSFSKHRAPPNDGIYDARVVVFVNTSNLKIKE
ncbi:MAG: hypothetical protein HOO91_20505 [Bacteroidales bacterium]|nr:hypothetical protein [Bacteroidales bacterium]